MRSFVSFCMGAVLSCLVLAGCEKKQPGGPGFGGMPMQVVAVEARQQPVTERLSLVGTLTANEMIELQSEVDGTVEEIPFQEGQRVNQGDLLVRLDESKFAAAAAEAEANFKLAEITYHRARELRQDNLVSQQEFDQAAAAYRASQASLDLKRRQLKDARIRAPFSGVTGSRTVSPGQVISKNTVLTWLVDLDTLKVEFNVPERFLSQIRVGQRLDLKVAAYPNEKFPGEVYFIAPHVDPQTRTVLVKAHLSNPDHKLKPGMFANLDLTVMIRENSIVIPEPALVRVMQDDRAMVYTVSGTNTVQIRPVKLGARLPGEVEVLQGLQPGEKVIVEGVQKVGPGSKVALAAPKQATPPLEGAPAPGKERKGDAETRGQ